MNIFLRKVTYYRGILLLYVYLQATVLVCAQDFSVQLVEPFSRGVATYDVSKLNKTTAIKNINNGTFKYPFVSQSDVITKLELLALKGESKVISFTLTNQGSSVISQLALNANFPSSFEVKMFKQVLVNDWYSNQNANLAHLKFYGDPLLVLEKQKNQFTVRNIQPKETVRIVCEFKSQSAFKGNVDITAKVGNISQKEQVSLQVYNLTIPTLEFSSIAFNSNNFSTASEVVKLLHETGFTHLQVNPLPRLSFKQDGTLLSSSIEQKTSNSKSFRDVAYNWIKSDGTIVLFWQPSYARLAQLKDGTFIKPFTKSWISAYINLLDQVKKDLKIAYKDFNDRQIVVYLADEVTEDGLSKNGYSVKDLLVLNQAIKVAYPAIKTLVTFGFYSGEKEVNDLVNVVDIPIMHAVMPNQAVSRGKQYTPLAVKKKFKLLKTQSNLANAWEYNVESGVTADLRNFRFLPSVAAANGYNGFSWWAFSSHKGSTWTIDQKNGLNYSFYYSKELNNAIYKSLSKDLPDQSGLISSMRLKASRAGLIDAKIILAIAKNKNKLNSESLSKYNQIVQKIASYDARAKDNLNLPQLRDIEQDANTLRKIYATL